MMIKHTQIDTVSGPHIRSRLIDGTYTYITISLEMGFTPDKGVLLEVDRGLGMVRTRQAENLSQGERIIWQKTNYIRCDNVQDILPDRERVEMKLADDGWWYGYYLPPTELPPIAIDYNQPQIQAVGGKLYMSNKIAIPGDGLSFRLHRDQRCIMVSVHGRSKIKKKTLGRGIHISPQAQALIGNQVIEMQRVDGRWVGTFGDEVGA